jgi:hypothetical protein
MSEKIMIEVVFFGKFLVPVKLLNFSLARNERAGGKKPKHGFPPNLPSPLEERLQTRATLWQEEHLGITLF